MSKTQKRWTQVTVTEPVSRPLPPIQPHIPCKDEKRHAILIGGWQVEFRARICIWCDQAHATDWGRIVDEWLSKEQYALVQQLRFEEENKSVEGKMHH